MNRKAYIFCPTHFLNKDKIKIDISSENLYIAVDSGITTIRELKEFGITPSVMIGDFDSIDLDLLNSHEYRNIKKIGYQPEKDDTDFMLAVNYALEQGYKEIVVIGGLDGRIDHTLANIFCLKYISENGADGYITNGYNRVRYLKNSSVKIKKEHKYVSIVPLCSEVRGVTLRNFKYTLNNASIEMKKASYTTSNEILGENEGEIEILCGEVLICECDDLLFFLS